jgi:hypothetical protein
MRHQFDRVVARHRLLQLTDGVSGGIQIAASQNNLAPGQIWFTEKK